MGGNDEPATSAPATDEGNTFVPVWDIWVRLFHWSLATAVAFQLLSGLTGWQFFDWHRTGGEVVLALVLFRLMWGLLGSANARLGALVRSPVAAFHHLGELARRNVPPERRHNAAGSWAVLALLLMLGVQAVTGMLIADEDEFVEGAWYGAVDEAMSERLYRVHHVNAELLEALVVVHVTMIALYFFWARRDLLLPMITGRMRWPANVPLPPLALQRWWVGLPLAALALGAVGLAGGWFG